MRTVDGIKLLLKKADAVSLDAMKNSGSMTDFIKAVRIANPQYSIRDVAWGILNKKKSNYIKKNDLQSASTITWQMARLRYEQGNEWFSLMQQSHQELLKSYYNERFYSKVQILSASNDTTCAKCKALNGKTYTIKEAIEKMPLPVEGCEWCRCTYMPILK
ncbi:hypothetical protein [Dehalococcoides mccartyi]|uniref:hypothetical protein n=1 Tax=Dehalococcoides mccartyi TaxID=61435 RepID=UPI00059E20D4|nr:hypothetical protein [Dehalococcoides mccartyi]